MVVRKLTLSEWFLRYQLLKIGKTQFFNPGQIDVDISALSRRFGGWDKIPLTAILVKAAALLHRRQPQSHRVVLSTLLGPRLIEFSEPRVNLPLLMKRNGETHLTATVIEQAQNKTVEGLSREMGLAAKGEAERYPIAKFCADHSNHFLNRMLLKVVCFAAYRMPHLFAKKAGGISVSCLFGQEWIDKGMLVAPMGPTAISIGAISLSEKANGAKVLRLGVGYNHTAFLAIDCVKAISSLEAILTGKDKELFEELCKGEEEDQLEQREKPKDTAISFSPSL
ncbi:MAG: hypothetical protein HRT45_01400 [Bdellovibrionales bacterium]|nr:hypothetical protein [Bdellovibrionales bacterium]